MEKERKATENQSTLSDDGWLLPEPSSQSPIRYNPLHMIKIDGRERQTKRSAIIVDTLASVSEKVKAYNSLPKQNVNKTFRQTGSVLLTGDGEKKKLVVPTIDDKGIPQYTLKDGETYYVEGKTFDDDLTIQLYTDEKIEIGSSTFLLNRFLEDPNLPDIEIHGLAHFNQYSTFTLKVALEELIGDYESCLTATVEVHSWIKQITTLTIDFFKEWNQYSNVSSLPIVQMSLKCSGILEVMKNSNEKFDKLDKKFEVTMEKTNIFLPTIPELVEINFNRKIKNNKSNIEYYEADLTVIDKDKKFLESKVDEKKKDVTAAKADQKDLEKELNSIFHSLLLALHDIFVETAFQISSIPASNVIDKIILENREIDRKRLERAEDNVRLTEEKLEDIIKNSENDFKHIRKITEDLNKKINFCISENESMQMMVNCVKQLRNYLRRTMKHWSGYKIYIMHFKATFSSLKRTLEYCSTNHDKSFSLHKLSTHVLEIIGYCYSLQNIAEIHENISHKFVNPIDFSFFNDLTMEQVEVEIQKNLEEANKYLKLELENAKENVPNNIVDFARLYSKTTKATEAKEEEPKI